jgi:hypothetical protein
MRDMRNEEILKALTFVTVTLRVLKNQILWNCYFDAITLLT